MHFVRISTFKVNVRIISYTFSAIFMIFARIKYVYLLIMFLR